MIAIVAVIVLIGVAAFGVTQLHVHAQNSGFHEILQFGPDATTGEFYSLAYSPDGRWIAVGTYTPHTIEIRNAITGQIVKTLADQSEQGSEAIPIWSPDGQYIAEVDSETRPTSKPNSVIQDGRAYVWEGKTGKRIEIATRNVVGSKYADSVGDIGIRYVVWRPNGKEFLVVDNDRKLRLIDFPSGKLHWIISPYDHQPAEFANAESEYPCRPQWSPDGSRFACIGDGIEGIFDGVTGNHVFDLEDEVALDAHPQWSNDGKFIFNVDIGDGGNTFSINVWNAEDGFNTNLLPVRIGFPFAVSPDNTHIAYVDVITNEVDIAALKTDDVLAHFALDYDPNDLAPAWSADGHSLAVIDRNSTVHIFTDKSNTF